MIPSNQPIRRQVIELILNYFLGNPDNRQRLTNLEDKFILQMSDDFYDRGDLLDEDCEILNRIYNR